MQSTTDPSIKKKTFKQGNKNLHASVLKIKHKSHLDVISPMPIKTSCYAHICSYSFTPQEAAWR